MDELIIGAIGLAIPAAGAAGFAFARRKHEFDGVEMSPRGGHKHSFDTMLGDGKGWRCGYEVEKGVICGWLRYGEEAPRGG
jgi:hypothetical protein